MGLGKTVQALMAVPPGAKVLVFTVKSAIGVWEVEIAKWTGNHTYSFTGTAPQRKKVWQRFSEKEGTAFLVTNYSQASNVQYLRAKWDVIILDEAHKVKSRNALVSRTLEGFSSPRMYQLTGSPMPHDPGDLWMQLHLLDPKTFPSYYRFVDKYMHMVPLDYKPEVKVVEGIKDRAGLHALLSQYALRRTKRSVGIQLPPKTRQHIPCILSPLQRRLYRDMEKDLIASISEDNTVISPNTLVAALRCRQLIISPAVLDGEDDSGVLDSVMERLELELEARNKVVVFSCFLKTLDLLIARLAKKFLVPTFKIVGGMRSDDTSTQLRNFQESEHAAILLSSVNIAQGWSATSAVTAMFVGASYSAEVNYQAEDRLHRIGQHNPVNILYFKTEEDDRVFNILNTKARLSKMALPVFGEESPETSNLTH